MRVVFLGSGAFAIPGFEALFEAGHEIAALVTQPDREKGRGRTVTPPPLKPVAEARRVPVLQPRRVREPELQAALAALRPEIQVVIAYGQILPRSLIDLAPRGTVNVHASLLPRFRGAAPIQWAIASGETETGVTTMMIDEGLDTGPLLLSRSLAIGPEETAADLEPRLARLGADVLLETLGQIARGTLPPRPQEPSLATYAPLLSKEDGRIDWHRPADATACRVRGFTPWPGAHTTFGTQTLKVLRARSVPGVTTTAAPGEIAAVGPTGLSVACGRGTVLCLELVQPESRKPMSASAWAAGARVAVGARLGG